MCLEHPLPWTILYEKRKNPWVHDWRFTSAITCRHHRDYHQRETEELLSETVRSIINIHVSFEVECTFLCYKAILTDRRQNFKFNNLKQYFVTHCYRQIIYIFIYIYIYTIINVFVLYTAVPLWYVRSLDRRGVDGTAFHSAKAARTRLEENGIAIRSLVIIVFFRWRVYPSSYASAYSKTNCHTIIPYFSSFSSILSL